MKKLFTYILTGVFYLLIMTPAILAVCDTGKVSSLVFFYQIFSTGIASTIVLYAIKSWVENTLNH